MRTFAWKPLLLAAIDSFHQLLLTSRCSPSTAWRATQVPHMCYTCATHVNGQRLSDCHDFLMICMSEMVQKGSEHLFFSFVLLVFSCFLLWFGLHRSFWTSCNEALCQAATKCEPQNMGPRPWVPSLGDLWGLAAEGRCQNSKLPKKCFISAERQASQHQPSHFGSAVNPPGIGFKCCSWNTPKGLSERSSRNPIVGNWVWLFWRPKFMEQTRTNKPRKSGS